ncbi:uncharacterized protein CBL_13612 [Carabus blaptoides fortunei]
MYVTYPALLIPNSSFNALQITHIYYTGVLHEFGHIPGTVSIGETCHDLKKEYDTCFNTWFADHFLRGDTNDKMCAPMFKVYQECVKEAMKHQKIEITDVEKDLLGTANEREAPPKKS